MLQFAVHAFGRLGMQIALEIFDYFTGVRVPSKALLLTPCTILRILQLSLNCVTVSVSGRLQNWIKDTLVQEMY